MNVAVIGVGALGSLLGFYLSGVPGHTVWLLGQWPDQITTLQQAGLVCVREDHQQRRAVQATTQPEQIGACDVVLVVVKSGQTAQAAIRARALLHATTLVVTLQNGLGNREVLAQALHPQPVLQGVTTLGATLIGPGQVRHAGMGTTFFATSPTTGESASLTLLVDLFRAAGLPAEVSPEVETLIWNKLVVNVGINALTALLRVPNGALLDLPPARTLIGQLVAEAAAVATARGTPITGDPLAQVMAVAEATAGNHSSMLQDVRRGAPTEIATMNGAIVREGQRLGIATPYNQAITLLVEALDYTASTARTAASTVCTSSSLMP